MRLKKLKLAGFKSFVDPTTIPLPTNLIAVVGPNGCGKSNVIDAVRWVMGESSAKHLRGESMADVIFNGSQTRKPVGQAHVELIFDNTQGSIGGEYAKYNEISIRRLVNQNGQSHYYLNGTRCRRKDITNIFLGTGLGPRSYSIIEQGMISRLVEAKPDDLRLFLEEAAGISKYKERRRETENRIRHTRENLERLTDIRDELGKQLERLNRQAKAAEKYKILREEERLLKAQLLVLRWQVLDEKAQNQNSLINEKAVQMESYIAEQRHFDSDIETHRQLQVHAQDKFNEVQTHYYSIGSDIARLEEAIAHQRDKEQQLEQDLIQADADIVAARQHLSQDQATLETLKLNVEKIEPEFNRTQTTLNHHKDDLHQVEHEQAEWQQQWEQFNMAAAESSKLAHVEQANIQHIETKLQALIKQIEQLQQEQNNSEQQNLPQEIEELLQEQAFYQSRLQEEQAKLTDLQQAVSQKRQHNHQVSERLDKARSELQHMHGQQASLTALQQAALGKEDNPVLPWLQQLELIDNPRLAEHLTVAEGWDVAVETVLANYLQAVCVDDISSVADAVNQIEKGDVTLLDTQAAVLEKADNQAISLASFVATKWAAAQSLLANIFVAETVTEALSLVRTLNAYQSVVTREGIWIGNGWMRVAKGSDETAGILKREAVLKQLVTDIEKQQHVVNQLVQEIEEGQAALQNLESQQDIQLQSINQIKTEEADIGAKLQIKQAQLKQWQQRQAEIKQELIKQNELAKRSQDEMQQARNRWNQAMQAMDQDADRREDLVVRRDEINQQLDTLRSQVKNQTETLRQLELQLQSNKTQVNSLQETAQRTDQRITELELRREGLAIALQKMQTPDEDINEKLQQQLTLHHQIEEDLKLARAKVEEIEESISLAEQKRSLADQNARAIQSRLEQLRVDAQNYVVRISTIEEQLAESEYTLETLRQEMPIEANEKAWEENLQQINNRISRLGAINLAAIEEFQTESERKAYLDSQHEDLIEALTTLENAIAKIDKETKQRFQETYNNVNDKFKVLFPRLFGGGNAYLELTGDNLLDTGVSVIARPPGKRNSSIHLLSGGEKAMTAIALVFAIFHLNPSPFCMLDEVDAPLDDANVVRYCNMVKEMSQSVQFTFITHNKITMELADRLVGVTMQEPGVSRLVSVDIGEAVSMAEA